jgi:hypothetical protein
MYIFIILILLLYPTLILFIFIDHYTFHDLEG